MSLDPMFQIKEYILENFASKFAHQKLDKHKMTGKNCQGKECM